MDYSQLPCCAKQSLSCFCQSFLVLGPWEFCPPIGRLSSLRSPMGPCSLLSYKVIVVHVFLCILALLACCFRTHGVWALFLVSLCFRSSPLLVVTSPMTSFCLLLRSLRLSFTLVDAFYCFFVLLVCAAACISSSISHVHIFSYSPPLHAS